VQIESVRAIAFGPLCDATLTLAPGMNLIHGANEAGKSSWHAALFAGLCGMPRGRGRSRREDQEFRDRHRPWDGGAWQVGTVIALADGRRVELRHDLDGRVDCSAQDAVLGRDYGQEIISDGAPDGARWLGLDRRSFLAIACVRQADLLGVLEKPDLLKEYLQRAADSLAQDTSVASALDRIEQYRKDYVGRDAAGAVKPLRRAKERQERAAQLLAVRQAAQEDYLGAVDAVQQFEETARRAASDLAAFRARRAAQIAQEGQHRLLRARRLAALHRTGAPASLSSDDALAQRVAMALHAWATRPAAVKLTGDTVADLRTQLAALPALPVGDLEPNADVQEAAQAFDLSVRQQQYHEAQRPVDPRVPATGGAMVAELRQLAGVLGEPAPEINAALPERLRRAKERAAATKFGTPSRLPLIAAGILALLGLAAALGHVPVVGIALVIVAVAVAVVLLLRSPAAAGARLQEDLRVAELALRKAQLPGEEREWRRAIAVQRLQRLNLPADVATLERLAADSEAAEQAQREVLRWAGRRDALQSEVQANAARLVDALQARGVHAAESPAASYAAYRAACSQRQVVARQAARRPDLEQLLADRVRSEATTADTLGRCERAEQQVREAATAIGAPGDDPDRLAQELSTWQQERHRMLTANDTARQTWTELQALLDGGTLDDLAARVQRQLDLATRFAADVDPKVLTACDDRPTPVTEPDPAAEEQRLAAAAGAAQTSLDQARGQLEERQRTLGSIAEAEEELAAAQGELDTILQLDRTLALTRTFLERAQQSVHQSVAPVLAGAVQRRLPAITAHRYTEVRVDPENLDVQVLAPDGHWRHAALLSHGTAEQIYLLLRVALAEYLTKPGEVCPLILDDVTVHCDRERKAAVLETLYRISRERQVILFSQEEGVLAWARAHFQAPADRITPLAAV
jgi:exonuclease SbcC